MSDQEIASKLNLSIHTVRSYWLRIRSKMGDGSRTQLAVSAMQYAMTEAAHMVLERSKTAAMLETDTFLSQAEALAAFELRLTAERAILDEILGNDIPETLQRKLKELREATDDAMEAACIFTDGSDGA
jgi:hypothetical protein